MLFFLLENWQAEESILILETQFNPRNNSVLTEPTEEDVKESTGA